MQLLQVTQFAGNIVIWPFIIQLANDLTAHFLQFHEEGHNENQLQIELSASQGEYKFWVQVE